MKTDFKNKKCEPCSGNTPKLTLEEIQYKLLEVNKKYSKED